MNFVANLLCRSLSRMGSSTFRCAVLGNRQLTYRWLAVNLQKVKLNTLPSFTCREPSATVKFSFANVLTTILVALGMKDSEEAKKDPLVVLVKKAIYARAQLEFDKAEDLLHEALAMAKGKEHEKAITYIYTIMAENSIDQFQFANAEKLFKLVLSRILGEGLVTEDDEAVIDISLQLAKLYSEKREFEKAEEGFKFSLDHQKKRIATIKLDDGHELTETEKNSLAIYAMGLDWLARHNVKKKEYGIALKNLKEALSLSTRISGEYAPQTITLTNDVGVVAELHGNITEAIDHFERAIKLGTTVENGELMIYYLNLGMAYLQVGEIAKAKSSCTYTFMAMTSLAEHDMGKGNKPLRFKAMRCLEYCEQANRKFRRKDESGKKSFEIPVGFS